MKSDASFECKYCGRQESHDRRRCRGALFFAEKLSNPEWVSQMKERNRKYLKAKWAKVKQFEWEHRK